MLDIEEYKFILDQIRGLIVVDEKGIIRFMSEQCCGYLKLDHKDVIGKQIDEVFPPTKIMEALKRKKPETTDFYFVDGRVGASTRFPLKKGNRVVGMMEYDLFQQYDSLAEFIDSYMNLDEELAYYRDEVRKFRGSKYTIDNIIGSSEQTMRLKDQIRSAARTDSTVIIHGETGTGKELVAHSIHNLSKRSLRNFIKINGASLPENLVESELFGYEGGAFTGAVKEGRKGKFELADRGTLFLDEINQMPQRLQPKLLRVLQEKEIDRIGSDKSMPIDVRIVAATNENLESMVRAGRFRQDLYYRLNVIEIKVPPLRDRREDILEIVGATVDQLNYRMGKNVTRIDDRVFQVMKDYDWPGNIRELQNVIERAMNYVEDQYLSAEYLDLNVKNNSLLQDEIWKGDNPIEDIKRHAEKDILIRVLEEFGGNKKRCAEFLKISRSLLYQKMKRLGINM